MIAETILAYSTAFNQPPAASAAMTSMQRLSMRAREHLLLACLSCMFSSAHAADAAPRTFELNIVQGSAPAAQRVIKVEKGDALKLKLTSDAPGELHLHGYRLAAKLVPGQPAELAFTAYATGRYPFEWHAENAANAESTHRRGPPLATLEVRPN
jgi:hypothetical protein